MRRAKDLPVFVSLATRRSPAPRSWLTSSGVASEHGSQSEDGFLAFRGPSWVDPPARRRLPEEPRVALEKINSSGASDQLVRTDAWVHARRHFLSASLHRLPAEIGASVPSSCLRVVADLPWEAGTSVPITLLLCAPPRVAQSGKNVTCPVDNGDIADRIGTIGASCAARYSAAHG